MQIEIRDRTMKHTEERLKLRELVEEILKDSKLTRVMIILE